MKKSVLLFAALLLMCSTAAAQKKIRSYEEFPHVFVGLQGGGQLTFTNYQNRDLITPIGAVSVGSYFSPIVGARVNVSGWKGMTGLKGHNRTVDYKYVTSNLDLMLNLSQVFFPNRDGNIFNAVLLGGFGLAYVWDQENIMSLRRTTAISNPSLAWEDDRLVRNLRVGMQLDFNVSKHLGINLEVTGNNYGDRFNSKKNGHGDWQLTALVGVAIKFVYCKLKDADMSSTMANDNLANEQMLSVATAPVAKNAEKEEKAVVAPAPVVKPEPKPEPKPQPAPAPKLEKTKAEIFYAINSSAISASEEVKVRALAEWLKAHPKASAAVVAGYADAGTGNASVNMRISKKRADAVVKMLTEKYGVDKSRLTVEAKGDKVQPYKNNDDNRVVIVTAEEK